MVFGFGKKKEENKNEKKLSEIIKEELSKRNLDINKYNLFIFKIYNNNESIYLPSTSLKYFDMIGNIGDAKILNIKELDEDIVKIDLESKELYDRIKSALGFLEKLAGFKI